MTTRPRERKVVVSLSIEADWRVADFAQQWWVDFVFGDDEVGLRIGHTCFFACEVEVGAPSVDGGAGLWPNAVRGFQSLGRGAEHFARVASEGFE